MSRRNKARAMLWKSPTARREIKEIILDNYPLCAGMTSIGQVLVKLMWDSLDQYGICMSYPADKGLEALIYDLLAEIAIEEISK